MESAPAIQLLDLLSIKSRSSSTIILSIAGEKKDGFIHFPRLLECNEVDLNLKSTRRLHFLRTS